MRWPRWQSATRDRHRQLDAKPYASGCAECKQLLLDQLQQPAFLRFIASSSNEHQYLLFDMRTSCRAFYQSDQPAACKLLLVV